MAPDSTTQPAEEELRDQSNWYRLHVGFGLLTVDDALVLQEQGHDAYLFQMPPGVLLDPRSLDDIRYGLAMVARELRRAPHNVFPQSYCLGYWQGKRLMMLSKEIRWETDRMDGELCAARAAADMLYTAHAARAAPR